MHGTDGIKIAVRCSLDCVVTAIADMAESVKTEYFLH